MGHVTQQSDSLHRSKTGTTRIVHRELFPNVLNNEGSVAEWHLQLGHLKPLMRLARVELAIPSEQLILSQSCIPIPPQSRVQESYLSQHCKYLSVGTWIVSTNAGCVSGFLNSSTCMTPGRTSAAPTMKAVRINSHRHIINHQEECSAQEHQ